MEQANQPNSPPVKIKPPNAKGAFKALMKKYLGTVVYSFVFGFVGFIYSIFIGEESLAVRLFMYTQMGAFILGILHALLAPRFISWIEEVASVSMIIFLFILMMLGFTIIVGSQHIESISSIPLNYAWALLLFAIPTIWAIAYEYLVSIPQKVFKTWKYPYGKEIPVIEVVDPIKVNFYIEKKAQDDSYSEFTLNVPPKYSLGEFMHYFIHRYNYDKNPDDPIYISADNSDSGLYEWLFRRKPRSSKNKHVMDPDLSFVELGIIDNDKIVVERNSVGSERAPLYKSQFDKQETIEDEQ